MRLMTAHKILIGTSVAFFIYFSGWELTNFFGAGAGRGLGAGPKRPVSWRRRGLRRLLQDPQEQGAVR